MALTEQELQTILSKLTPEEPQKLIEQLHLTPEEVKKHLPKSQPTDNKIYCCVYCGSTDYIKHGKTNQGLQRYKCKDCGKTFSENHGDSLRYSHLTQSEWLEIFRGIVDELSIPKIVNNVRLSKATVWLAKIKVAQALMTMYGYEKLFQGITQADEYSTRAAFKGKRDLAFFFFVLERPPRSHRLINKGATCHNCMVENNMKANTIINSKVKRDMPKNKTLFNIGQELIDILGEYDSFKFPYLLDYRYKVFINNHSPGGALYAYSKNLSSVYIIGKSFFHD